ncbi:HlyD family secretion protein [Enterovibrio paralichthyis]|uniref:HlyD family secretion protein n=1 Tax=Enterovibrio paralichthyis TaxID=2853805 RepID=UPI001C45949C|nr:HlyD family secretion protein [Enterovibrio paralichthyis]MBV7298418.1 HlyD family secretion protein [Enterovibrio paralichthyis]
MSDETADTAASDESEKQTAKSPVSSARRFTYYLIVVALLLWFYTLWADRVTPMTDHGRVNGQIIRISPQVSGPIASISVINNATVKQGQLLLTIERDPFELKVTAARLQLQQATQSVNADSSAIDAAKANEVAAKVKLANAKQHAERNRSLARRGVVSQATLDDSVASLNSAKAALAQATADLEKARQALGPKGENNPQVKSALNNLDQALLNLSYTELRSPAGGVITNMNLAAGDYAAAGHPMMTYVNNRYFWLTAMVAENSLAYLNRGTLVKVVLDAYPGRIFHGEVTSIGWGSSGNGNLEVNSNSGLFNSPTGIQHAQRFPVNIRFFDLPPDVTLRYGGRATVSFYPGQSEFGEWLLDLWTWIWSYLSYVS